MIYFLVSVIFLYSVFSGPSLGKTHSSPETKAATQREWDWTPEIK